MTNDKKLQLGSPNASEQQNNDLRTDLGLNDEDFKALKKKLKKLKNRDDKAFMDMLRTVSRNHYILNQMVDRKARILLSVNALILSIIILSKVTMNGTFTTWNLYLLIGWGLTCFISVIYSMLAVIPEKTHGTLNETLIKQKLGNPLFFGNFKNMTEKMYEDTMMEMVNDRDFMYRSMIQDIYHLGKVLERKRKNLKRSLYVFIVGLSISLFVSYVLHLVDGV